LPHLDDRSLNILDETGLFGWSQALDNRLQKTNGSFELLKTFAFGGGDADGEITDLFRQLVSQNRKSGLPVRDNQDTAARRHIVTNSDK